MTKKASAQRPEWMAGLLTPLTDFLVAVQFLTVLPPILRRAVKPDEMGRAVGYYPLVGGTVGVILLGANHLLSGYFPPLVSAALLLTLWVLLAGALHIDGFLDACDGLLGGLTSETRLEIMRDSRMGAFALAGGVLLLLLKFAALATLTMESAAALLLAPVLGRWGMSLAIVAFPYARPEGLGKAMKDNATWRQAALATVITLAVAWSWAGGRGLAVTALALVVMLLAVRFTLQRIPGLTGDTYGMLNELIETVVLLAFTTSW